MRLILLLLVFAMSGLGQMGSRPGGAAPRTSSISASQINTGTLPLARGGTGNPTWIAGRCVQVSADGTKLEVAAAACGSGGGGDMVYPGAGVPKSTGSAWDTSYAVGTSANNLVQLNGSGQLPAVSAALLTNFPTFNQSTTGNAATATALATARTIFGVSFDGSANIGTRSGNTSEMATVSGTKTVDKQLKFDASGNIVASTTDIGAGTGGSTLANVLGSENTATLSSWGTLAAVGSAGNCVSKNISFTGVVSGARLILGVPSALPATVVAKVTPGTDLAVVTLCNVGNAAVSADLDGTYTVLRLEVLE